MEKLFTPMKVGNRIAPNRIVFNAMECSDALENGDPSPATYKRYEDYFKGKAGIVVLEAITPQYDYIARKNQLSILEHNLPGLKKFISHLKKINPETLILFQVTHSGEISSNKYSQRIRVSEEPLYGYEDSILVREKEINQVIEDYANGCRLAYEVGADGVDIKLCHGYLGTQILRPYNKDDWKYGGKWENRRQFAIDLYRRCVEVVPCKDFLFGSKISVYEGFPGGVGTAGPDSAVMDLTETIDLAKTLEAEGAHYILQSAGSPSHTLALAHPDRKVPDYSYIHHYFQKVLRENLKPETKVFGSGYTIFRDGKQPFLAVKPENNTLRFWGNKNIEDGVVDGVAIGRQSFADPYTPLKMMEGRDKDVKWCTLCDHCVELLIRQHHQVGCATYDPTYTQAYLDMIENEGHIKAKHT